MNWITLNDNNKSTVNLDKAIDITKSPEGRNWLEFAIQFETRRLNYGYNNVVDLNRDIARIHKKLGLE